MAVILPQGLSELHFTRTSPRPFHQYRQSSSQRIGGSPRLRDWFDHAFFNFASLPLAIHTAPWNNPTISRCGDPATLSISSPTDTNASLKFQRRRSGRQSRPSWTPVFSTSGPRPLRSGRSLCHRNETCKE